MIPPMTPTMRAILQDVSERRRVSVKELLGESRAQSIARPRQEAMALMYLTGKYSLPRIGAVFNRHHTSVLHAWRVHLERINPQTGAKPGDGVRASLSEATQGAVN